MTGSRTSRLAAIALAAFSMAPVAAGTMLLGADPAFAGSENGKAGEHGKSGQQGNGASASSKGQEASEAKATTVVDRPRAS